MNWIFLVYLFRKYSLIICIYYLDAGKINLLMQYYQELSLKQSPESSGRVRENAEG